MSKARDKNLEEMSDKELQKLQNDILSEVEARKQARTEEQRRKKDYQLVVVEPTYHIDYQKFYEDIFFLIYEEHLLLVSADKVTAISDKCKIEDPIPKEKRYPCPNCGEMSLRIRDYSERDVEEDYVIGCDHCDFECQDHSGDYGETWWAFDQWLRKNGYLEKEED